MFRRLGLVVVALLAASVVAPAGAEEPRTGSRVEGPLRPKPRPAPAASHVAPSWTKTPDGRLQWRDGTTSVTVSGSVTVDTMIHSERR